MQKPGPRVIVLAMAVLAMAAIVEAAPKSKSKGKKARPFEAGEEVTLVIRGDEAKKESKARKVGLVRANSLVLPKLLVAQTEQDIDYIADLLAAYERPVQDADKLGFEELIKQGAAIEINKDTKLAVLHWISPNARPPVTFSMALPAPEGVLRVRVLEGRHKGQVTEVPVRNVLRTEAK